MKAPAKSVPPRHRREPDVAAVDLGAVVPDPAIALVGQRRAGRAERAQRRQVGHVLAGVDAGLEAAGVERGAGAEEVVRSSAAKRHSVVQSGAFDGPAGLPSYRQIVVPPSSAPTWQFHMIQPVLEYQWIALAGEQRWRDVVVQRAELERLEHHAAMAVHDRLRQAGGAARIDDPQRMVERQPLGSKVASACSRRGQRVQRATRWQRADIGARAAGCSTRCARSATRRSSRAAPRVGRAPRRRSGSRRRRSAPWARSGGSGRAPPPGPCRASRPTRRRRGWRRRGTRPRSPARFGR